MGGAGGGGGGKMVLIKMAKKPTPIAPPPAYESKGIPGFAEKTVVPVVNKVEVIGEVCESCSA